MDINFEDDWMLVLGMLAHFAASTLMHCCQWNMRDSNPSSLGQLVLLPM